MNLKSLFGKGAKDSKVEAPKTSSLPLKKVLVVDDDLVIRKTFQQMLSGDYEVLLAEDGAEAVTATRQQNPEIILLDLNFLPDPMSGPFSDGFDIVRWLHQELHIKSIPVIIVSDMDPAKYRDRFEEGEIAGFYQKPLRKKELIAAIEAVLGKN